MRQLLSGLSSLLIFAGCASIRAPVVPAPPLPPEPGSILVGVTFASLPATGAVQPGRCKVAMSSSAKQAIEQGLDSTLAGELAQWGLTPAPAGKATLQAQITYTATGGCADDVPVTLDASLTISSAQGKSLVVAKEYFVDAAWVRDVAGLGKAATAILVRHCGLTAQQGLFDYLDNLKHPGRSHPTQVVSYTVTGGGPATVTEAPSKPLRLEHAAKMLVLPLKARTGIAKDASQLVTSYLLSQLDGVEGLKTVGKADIEAMMDVDKQKQAVGCDSVSCMAEIGGALGADLVLYGDVGRLDGTTNVNLSVVSSSNARVVARASRLIEGSNLLSEVKLIVPDLVGKLNRKDPTSSR